MQLYWERVHWDGISIIDDVLLMFQLCACLIMTCAINKNVQKSKIVISAHFFDCICINKKRSSSYA